MKQWNCEIKNESNEIKKLEEQIKLDPRSKADKDKNQIFTKPKMFFIEVKNYFLMLLKSGYIQQKHRKEKDLKY